MPRKIKASAPKAAWIPAAAPVTVRVDAGQWERLHVAGDGITVR